MKTTLKPTTGFMLAFTLIIPLLAACGGGGGGSSTAATQDPPTTMPDPTPTAADVPDTYTQVSDPLSADNLWAVNADNTGTALGIAATARPRFGSVTQSSNVDSNGITTDSATATFDGTHASIQVARDDGSSFTYGTDSGGTYLEGEFTQAQKDRFLPASWERGRYSYNVRRTETSYHADYIGTGWDSDNPASFSVWGYWLRTDGADPFLPGTEFEAGAFVDGPAFDSDNPPTLPASGSATYVGEAQWLYHHEYETVGIVEIGQGVGPLAITANFSDSSLSVCISCSAQARVYGDARGPDGEWYRFDDVATDYRLEATATINSDGSFRTKDVTLINPSKPIINQEGSVGGLFSNSSASDGNPDSVVGTHGGKYTHEGESGSWVGTFGGLKQ